MPDLPVRVAWSMAQDHISQRLGVAVPGAQVTSPKTSSGNPSRTQLVMYTIDCDSLLQTAGFVTEFGAVSLSDSGLARRNRMDQHGTS